MLITTLQLLPEVDINSWLPIGLLETLAVTSLDICNLAVTTGTSRNLVVAALGFCNLVITTNSTYCYLMQTR